MKLLYTILLVISGIIYSDQVKAQNYIPYYSFEDTVTRTTPLFLPEYWTAATYEGWNYFTPLQNSTYPDWGAPSNLIGYQVANTGNSYVGISLYNLWTFRRITRREYLQVELKKSLRFDSTYCIQLYISFSDSAHFASKNVLGVYFSQNAISGNFLHSLPYSPQLIISPNQYITDKINWVKIDLQYKSTGNEKFITIGNFNDTNYIDTTFVSGGGDQFWMKQSYYYLDDIWLSHCDSIPDSLVGIRKNHLKNQVSVYPNPFRNFIQIENKSNRKLKISLINSLGQIIPIQKEEKNFNYQLNTEGLKAGLYWLIVSDGINRKTFKLIKD